MITAKEKQIIKRVTKKANPSFIGIFGSYARGDQNENSDLDILIDFDEKLNLLDIIGMEQELTELLGIKVDLITRRSLNQSIKPYIESDLIRVV